MHRPGGTGQVIETYSISIVISYVPTTIQSHKLQCIVETITGVIDVKDMKLSQITNDFLTLTKLLAEIDQKQYPETLGRIFIINVPSVFPFVWRMVRPWIGTMYVCMYVCVMKRWLWKLCCHRSRHGGQDRDIRGPEGIRTSAEELHRGRQPTL